MPPSDDRGRTADELFAEVYDELRRLAARFMQGERASHTLQPTALVHEAYLRLASGKQSRWDGRSHFLAVAARQMRRVLVDHARARGAEKRVVAYRLTSFQSIPDPTAAPVEILDLDEALERLASLSERQAKVFELRYFAGMSVVEVARLLEVSERTVKGDWQMARAWLGRELYGSG